MSAVNGTNLLGDFNFVSKYGPYNRVLKRRESRRESMDRMMDMHVRKYKDFLTEKHLFIIDGIRRALYGRELLGSQRALQFGGKGVERHNMRIYNCAVSYCDRPKFFAECFYMLLCGCGTGFSVQKHHVAQLPDLNPDYDSADEEEYIIEDSIEGWADAKDALVNFYFGLRETRPIFNYTKIRKRGAPLSVGGTAPGPEPLRNALTKIEQVFIKAHQEGHLKLRPIHAYDIVMHSSDAVLSGGVRRSATIALFSPDDMEMALAKTGNWYIENPQRARSNNSAVLVRGEDNLEDFKVLMKAVKQFGEPGFIFVSSREHIYNPCVEVGMCPVLIKGPDRQVLSEYLLDILNYNNRDKYIAQGYTYESGWQCCNLSELNAAKWTCPEDAYVAAYRAAILGTLQAGYTNPGYLTDVSRQIIEREALIGVSMTGMMDNVKFAFDEKLQRDLAQIVIATNKEWSQTLGINQAARTTCVKPAGNSTILLSEQKLLASGINLHKTSGRMFRRTQVSKDDPVGQYFIDHNPHMVEESVWSANKTDVVITFPIEIDENSLAVGDISAIQFLEYVLSTQKNWVIPGTALPMSCEGLTHNVSNTCEVSTNEWSEVGPFIYKNQNYFSGLSLLGTSGDYVYQQAPMQRVYFESDLTKRFGEANVGAAKHMISHIKNRFGSLYSVMMPLKMVLEGASTRRAVQGTNVNAELLWDTYKKLRNLIHIEDSENILLLLASVGHEQYWYNLVSNLVHVDYENLIEDKDNTKMSDTVACSGGTCELDFTIPKG